MNRQQRRRQAAIQRQNGFYESYVRHLPEIAPDNLAGLLGEPGQVLHAVHYHDEGCRIYDGGACDCDPEVRFFAEPSRS
jgi:hypothetical protein